MENRKVFSPPLFRIQERRRTLSLWNLDLRVSLSTVLNDVDIIQIFHSLCFCFSNDMRGELCGRPLSDWSECLMFFLLFQGDGKR